MLLCAPWATYTDLTKAQAAEGDADEWGRWLTAASEILYGLSGRRYRGAGCSAEFTYDTLPPVVGTCARTACTSCSTAATGGRPAGSRAGIRGRSGSGSRNPGRGHDGHDGTVLDAAQWHLEGPWLYRVDGGGWPHRTAAGWAPGASGGVVRVSGCRSASCSPGGRAGWGAVERARRRAHRSGGDEGWGGSVHALAYQRASQDKCAAGDG